MITYIDKKIMKASEEGVELKLNWFDKKIAYTSIWISDKLWNIRFYFIQRKERLEAERTSHLKLHPSILKIKEIVCNEIFKHQKFRKTF